MSIQTINISLPVELVKKADKTAKREYRNRSELIREALRVYIRAAKTSPIDLNELLTLHAQNWHILSTESTNKDNDNFKWANLRQIHSLCRESSTI